MSAAAALGAAALIPYAVLVAGRASYDAARGLPACLAEAQTELRRSFEVLERACRTDGGVLSAGAPQQTLVQDVHCEVAVKLYCSPASDKRADSPSPKA
jgi:hypothetical protein